jgi:hypothetical protein
MIEDQDNNNVSVDRREETLVTRQPGFAATEQVVLDVAAERRLGLYQFNRIMFTILVFLEILLGFRFVLRLISANPESGFAVLVYGITGLFTAPFNGLIALPTVNGSLIEMTTLIAMVVYALIFWGILYVIRLIVERPRARSFVRTTREQAPGNAGSVRITHTTISNGNVKR